MSLDDQRPVRSGKVVEQELRDIRVSGRVKLGFGMFDDIHPRPRRAGRERHHRDRKNMREPASGVFESHAAALGRRSGHQVGVAALRHDVDAHCENPAIPLANRFSQRIVRGQRQRRVLPPGSKDLGGMFHHGEGRCEQATRALQMAHAGGPGCERLDPTPNPVRQSIRLPGNQPVPSDRMGPLIHPRNMELVGGLFAEPRPLQHDIVTVISEAPFRNLALGPSGP